MIFKKAPHQWCIDSCVPASMMHRFFPSASTMHRLSNPKSMMHRLSNPISTMHRLSPARIMDASIISPPHHWCIDNCDYFLCIDASINFNNRCGPLEKTFHIICNVKFDRLFFFATNRLEHVQYLIELHFQRDLTTKEKKSVYANRMLR